MHNEHPLDLLDSDHRRLVRAAARLLGAAEAEDAVQDAYVRALEGKVDQLNAAQAWLLTVVRNLAIDRLRRQHWMQQWLKEVQAHGSTALTAASAEKHAALAQEVVHALQLMASHLSPVDAAMVLLHEVFEVDHAELGQASGKSEAASRQQLRRALQRLRRSAGVPEHWPDAKRDADAEALLNVYLQALQLRDPQQLWAMLRQPSISAVAAASSMSEQAAAVAEGTLCSVLQVAGKLCLVLTLDGVTLCVMPLGAQAQGELATAP